MEPLGEDVVRELGRFGTHAALGQLVERWPQAVGEAVARHAWPARIQRDGTLLVHTSSSAWAFELTQLEASVREGLGELAPQRLKFVPGPLPEPATMLSAETTPAPPNVADSDRHEGALVASSITDENLRKLVARAAAASLAKARSDRRF